MDKTRPLSFDPRPATNDASDDRRPTSVEASGSPELRSALALLAEGRGGLVGGRLLQDYLLRHGLTAESPNSEPSPESLEVWFREKGFAGRFARSAPDLQPLQLAAREQLAQALRSQLALRWSRSGAEGSSVLVPPATTATATATTATADPTARGGRGDSKKPWTQKSRACQIFSSSAWMLLQLRKDMRALKLEVEELQERLAKEHGPPELLQRELPGMSTGLSCEFWRHYRQEDRKKSQMTLEAARLRTGTVNSALSRQSRAIAKNPQATGGKLAKAPATGGSKRCSLEDKAGFGVNGLNGDKASNPSSQWGIAGAWGFALPALGASAHSGSPGSRSAMAAAANSWKLDRHSSEARRTQAARYTRDRRSAPGATLPSIAQGMQITAVFNEGLQGQLLKKSASDSELLRPGSRSSRAVLRQSHVDELPPVIGFAETFHGPWSGWHPKPDVVADTATERYIQMCNNSGLVASHTALEMARHRAIVARNGEMLTNSDLAAVAAMIPRLDRLETVDLSGCDGIVMDDGVLTSLLRRLHGFPAGPTLKQLCLAGCRGAGREVVVEVVSLLKSPTGCRQLLSLDLNAIAVPGSLATALCEAARAHPTLRSVSLASTRLGSDAASRRAITELLGAAKLESLDLSWNCFPLEVFQSIGEAVNKSLTLQHLRLSNCTGCRAALGEAPCTSFLEKIAGGASALKTLDLSANLLNSAGALVLEDALERHAGLQELNVSQNSLGTTGLRSILRLLGSDSCGLQSIDCSDCASCGEEGGSEGGSTLLAGSGSHFNAANPCGRYELDFSRSCDRAALRQLYKLCQRARLAPDKAFRDQEFSEGPLSHPSAAGSGGVWPVPDSGKLQATFGIEAALPDYFPAPKASAEAESTAGRSFLRRCLGEGLLRTKPSQRKLAALLSKWAAATHNDDKEEQLLLLDAFSRGFQLDFPALKLFLSSSARPKEALARLLHCAAVETSHLQLLYTLTSGLDEHLSLYRSCRQLLHFDPENPTGRYKLDLRNTADYALAESLMALDRWESAVAQREGRADCSRNGDWSNIRNCSHGGAAIRKVREWHLHDWGSLSLDYVTWRRPTPGASELALPWRDWQRFLQTLTEGCADADDLLASLRAVSGSGGLFLFSWQLRELLGLFRHEKHRVECMVISYLRLVDPQNAKILRARIQNLSEFTALALRLGRSVVMPFYQPEDFAFEFDLGIFEDRLAASYMVQLAGRERIENIRDVSLVFPDGTSYKFEVGVPNQWETESMQPTEGKLSFKYICSPTSVVFAARKETGKTYSGWRADVKASEVLYWKALSEAPQVLLDFVYACSKHFDDADKIWSCLNEKGQGNVSTTEFQASMTKQASWSQYAADEELAKQLFRILNTDGSGEITPQEWLTMGLLLKELQLSLLEFLQQVDGHYAGDFDRAFTEHAKLDTNGDGLLEMDEWQAAVVTCGYFGPAMPIFRMAAMDGAVSRSRWMALVKTLEDRVAIRQRILEVS